MTDINTSLARPSFDAPNTVLKESDAYDAPLRAHRLNKRTRFLFGNIAEILEEHEVVWNQSTSQRQLHSISISFNMMFSAFTEIPSKPLW
ncbi:MAG: hypothetical protein WAL92_06905 [Thiogranum sp.]